jgi:biopolymer transport protein ExbD
MARHKTLILDNEGDTTLDISSLIDVCFLLLIYFIVTSTIIPRESDLGMEVPDKDPREKIIQPPIPPMVLRINDQGAVIAGHGEAEQVLDTDIDSRNLPLLLLQLDLYKTAAISSGDIPKVMLEVDENVRQQRTIDVLNAFAAAGISSVAFNELIRL